MTALERGSKNACDQILWFQKIPYIQERFNIRNSDREGSSKGDFQRIMNHKFNFKKDLGEKIRGKTKNLCVKRSWIYMYS